MEKNETFDISDFQYQVGKFIDVIVLLHPECGQSREEFEKIVKGRLIPDFINDRTILSDPETRKEDAEIIEKYFMDIWEGKYGNDQNQ